MSKGRKETSHVKSHDEFVSRTMARKKVAVELFETYLPKELLEKIDLKSIRKENTKFLSKILETGIVDILYSVKYKGKSGKYEDGYITFLLTEHQSTVDPMMSFRIQKYVLRIIEEYMKNKSDGTKLPLVLPLIIYNGKKKYTAARSFYELFEDEKLAKEYIAGEVKVIDVNQVNDEDLKDKYYMGMMLYMLHHIDDEQLMMQKIFRDLVKVISEKDFDYTKDVLYYVLERSPTDDAKEVVENFKQLVPPENEDDMVTTAAELLRKEGREEGFEKGVLSGMQKGKLEGIEQGMQQGMQQGMFKGKLEGKLETAKNLLVKGLDYALISEVTSLSVEEIKKLKK